MQTEEPFFSLCQHQWSKCYRLKPGNRLATPFCVSVACCPVIKPNSFLISKGKIEEILNTGLHVNTAKWEDDCVFFFFLFFNNISHLVVFHMFTRSTKHLDGNLQQELPNGRVGKSVSVSSMCLFKTAGDWPPSLSSLSGQWCEGRLCQRQERRPISSVEDCHWGWWAVSV